MTLGEAMSFWIWHQKHRWQKKIKLDFKFETYVLKRALSGISQVVQWLRLHAPNAGFWGLIPGQGTWSHVLQQDLMQSKKKALSSKKYREWEKLFAKYTSLKGLVSRGYKTATTERQISRDSPGGPMVKTLRSQCRGSWVRFLVRDLDTPCCN